MSLSNGVAFFDYGVAVSAKGEVFSFSEPSQLSDSCIWITDKEPDYIEKHFAGRARFKSSHFFGLRLKTIISDLGLQGLSHTEQAQVLQSIFHSTLESVERYGISVSRLQERLWDLPKSVNRQKHLKPIIDSAAQRYCVLKTSQAHQASGFYLYKSSAAAYKDIADIEFPYKEFRMLARGATSQRSVIEDPRSAAFVKLCDPQQIDALCGMHSWSMRDRVKDGGLWLSTPEFLYACSEMDIEFHIAESLASLSYATLNDLHPLGEAVSADPKKQRLQEAMSYSIFLMYESLLSAALGQGYKRLSFSEVYLSSVARMKLVTSVKALLEAGYDIQGYGAGRISLYEHPLKLPQDQRESFIDLVCKLGLLTPTVDFGLDLTGMAKSGYSTFFSYAASGDSNSLCQVNDYILEV